MAPAATAVNARPARAVQAQAQQASSRRVPPPAPAKTPRHTSSLGNSAAPAQRGFAGQVLGGAGGGVEHQPPPTSGDCEAGGPAPMCSMRGSMLYSCALELARAQQFEVARHVFAKAVAECPGFLKPWVSWAQMEKRSIPRGDDRRWAACREVLNQGLRVNPDAPPLLQAWGLLEMQRGNHTAALLLLDRSARLEPRNRPVLRWRPVIEARREFNASRFARLRARGAGGASKQS